MGKKNSGISRTKSKVILNLEVSKHYLSDVEMDILESLIKKIENVEYFMNQKAGNER